MTDLERTKELLTSLKIDFYFDERDFSQGMESSYVKIIIPTLNSIHIQVWYFYDYPNPNKDPTGKPGDFQGIDNWELKEKYWPSDEYDKPENEHLLFGQAPIVQKW